MCLLASYHHLRTIQNEACHTYSVPTTGRERVARPLCLKLRLISSDSAWQVRAADSRQGCGWHQQDGGIGETLPVLCGSQRVRSLRRCRSSNQAFGWRDLPFAPIHGRVSAQPGKNRVARLDRTQAAFSLDDISVAIVIVGTATGRTGGMIHRGSNGRSFRRTSLSELHEVAVCRLNGVQSCPYGAS